MSQSGSTTQTMGSFGSSTDSSIGAGGGIGHQIAKNYGVKRRKIVRILTVIAYIISVSTVALILSAYYVFIWKPSPPEESLPDKQKLLDKFRNQPTQDPLHQPNAHTRTWRKNHKRLFAPKALPFRSKSEVISSRMAHNAFEPSSTLRYVVN